jgi:hypothetical protein
MDHLGAPHLTAYIFSGGGDHLACQHAYLRKLANLLKLSIWIFSRTLGE